VKGLHHKYNGNLTAGPALDIVVQLSIIILFLWVLDFGEIINQKIIWERELGKVYLRKDRVPSGGTFIGLCFPIHHCHYNYKYFNLENNFLIGPLGAQCTGITGQAVTTSSHQLINGHGSSTKRVPDVLLPEVKTELILHAPKVRLHIPKNIIRSRFCFVSVLY
jgi:hypothetical protein